MCQTGNQNKPWVAIIYVARKGGGRGGNRENDQRNPCSLNPTVGLTPPEGATAGGRKFALPPDPEKGKKNFKGGKGLCRGGGKDQSRGSHMKGKGNTGSFF